MKIILASASPRRKQLLAQITDDFEIVTADIDERETEARIAKNNPDSDKISLAEIICQELAKSKASAVYSRLGCPKDTCVIGADTSVAVFDEIMGKPADREDAVRMLRKESTYPQTVVTGVALICGGSVECFSVKTQVFFRVLDESQEKRIQRYCDTNEPYDKAGAYGIQAETDEMIECYQGSYSNIVGLPVEELKEYLFDMGAL